MNISHYIPRGSNLVEEHKVLDLTNAHKLCTSVFKPMNVVSVMNMDPKEYKKVEERMSFSSNDSSRYHRKLFKM
jgi:hypothetical protein